MANIIGEILVMPDTPTPKIILRIFPTQFFQDAGWKFLIDELICEFSDDARSANGFRIICPAMQAEHFFIK